jgi:uncharacterized membrane protein HdeD (DUF308 family)
MSTQNEQTGGEAPRDPVLGTLPFNWKWMLALGILMAVLGIIGLGLTYSLTIVSVLWFGILAIIGGVAQLVDAFKYTGWRAVVAHVLVGLLYVGAGVVLIALPVQSAWWLTILIAAALIVIGVLRIIMAFQMKGASAIWVGLSGAISIILGALIYLVVDFPTQETLATPESAIQWFGEWGWVIGLFVAIELIVQGSALVALALTAKNWRTGSGDTRPAST